MLNEIIVYIIGGLLAGVATGLVGLSAATIIAPLFATVLGLDPYIAIGIALASDIFASALSAFHYFKNKNIHLKSATIMAISVLIFTVGGSYLSSLTKPVNLGIYVNVFVIFLGLRFLLYPVKGSQKTSVYTFSKSTVLLSIFWGAIIGLTSGYFGAGGGLSMLAVLTLVLGYDLKTAVGTSVFIMVFTALVGASSHIYISGTSWFALGVTSIFAMIGANLAAKYANKINDKLLNIIIGSLLLVFGLVLSIIYFSNYVF